MCDASGMNETPQAEPIAEKIGGHAEFGTATGLVSPSGARLGNGC